MMFSKNYRDLLQENKDRKNVNMDENVYKKLI